MQAIIAERSRVMFGRWGRSLVLPYTYEPESAADSSDVRAFPELSADGCPSHST